MIGLWSWICEFGKAGSQAEEEERRIRVMGK
jgi:hypothetical protein